MCYQLKKTLVVFHLPSLIPPVLKNLKLIYTKSVSLECLNGKTLTGLIARTPESSLNSSIFISS